MAMVLFAIGWWGTGLIFLSRILGIRANLQGEIFQGLIDFKRDLAQFRPVLSQPFLHGLFEGFTQVDIVVPTVFTCTPTEIGDGLFHFLG